MARPRYASTIVLVRRGDKDSFEILLTRRPRQMRFLGGFYVFPGGTVHEDDYSPKILARCRGVTGDDAQKILGKGHDRDVALGHWVAGIRELFEEVGVLICEPESENPLDFGNEGIKQRLEAKRKAIVRGELEFGEFLESERLCCDLSRLHYFFHRITPDIYPLRFDARFYIASLPADQTPLMKSEEVVKSVWLKPDAALSRVYRADFPILPPTTTVLDDLAHIGSWEKLRARFELR